MNDLQIFSNEEIGEVRAAIIDGEPWFVANDVCRILGLSNTTVAIDRIDSDEKSKLNLGLCGGETNCVNEYGLYTLVLASRKPKAKRFKRWITHEVIPSIRKTGSYNAKPMTIPEQIQLIAQGNVELTQRVDNMEKNLEDFKNDLPLLAVECQKITRAKNQKAIPLLGGKDSPAYKDRSIRSKVYSDIDSQLRREFCVNTYKAIKRSQCDLAISIIKKYELPMMLAAQIEEMNKGAA